ncbi:MAG: flagellar export chaperone FlgN [Mixta calida]|jgi:flagella synthesis protein FlgN|uniref:Flagellar biosynthesis protein FlgN n=1 Tax=Mixta calida TaxID=665913 RepID=A0ABM6RZW8_9GAMM|nr:MULTISPECIES: flagellar export chaperone FlgN [Mixta]AIX74146.1 flagellar biosynthesis protein FlgN [Pantoea sp. PSNIH2]MBS6058111.1 flagellar export chaperone FlgN [Pantoea sp.]POU51542.1 flagellar biosynthesis protein FlgN [Pantoea sp. PSNIH5]POU62885.1 flagellar biosynthesis protein FlgN [Pantoea sp. PSNIH4]POY69493.1 flagellar biosynthesis protein FlgN [Pantoea sp. PSNIH3]
MNSLITALDKMQEVLGSLSNIIKEEHEQLSAGFINSSLLQRITEDKSSLLTTLNYLDGMRRESEKQYRLQAPYRGQPELARRWQTIEQRTRQLRDNNTHNGMLLNQQVALNSKALALLKPHQTQAFYGPDGQATSGGFTSRRV